MNPLNYILNKQKINLLLMLCDKSLGQYFQLTQELDKAAVCFYQALEKIYYFQQYDLILFNLKEN